MGGTSTTGAVNQIAVGSGAIADQNADTPAAIFAAPTPGALIPTSDAAIAANPVLYDPAVGGTPFTLDSAKYASNASTNDAIAVNSTTVGVIFSKPDARVAETKAITSP
jgi:hypothetical protein